LLASQHPAAPPSRVDNPARRNLSTTYYLPATTGEAAYGSRRTAGPTGCILDQTPRASSVELTGDLLSSPTSTRGGGDPPMSISSWPSFDPRPPPISLSTLRTYNNSTSMFCSYVSDQRYGWTAFCEKQFGDVPAQICFEWNPPQHTADDVEPPGRRAFTKKELPHLFDVIDDFVDEQHRVGSNRWPTALQDSIAFKVGYACGLRRRELVMLDLTDFGPNPQCPRIRQLRRPSRASFSNAGSTRVGRCPEPLTAPPCCGRASDRAG
jgi:integrase